MITVRQLLTHTSGFEGDIFTDTGVGDDCVEKYLGVLHDVPQLFPPGSMWSYNNAGFSVLGRLVEVLRGKPYDVCLRERLVTPLGLTHVATSPYEAILFRAAVGHLQPAQDAPYQPAPVWAMLRSNIPAGSMLAMSPRSLLGFARMHLDDGRAPDGTQVLAPGTASRMHEKQVELPDLGVLANTWGLGFERFETPNGHDHRPRRRHHRADRLPQDRPSDAGVAVALLTNGGDTMALYADLVGRVLREVAGVEMPALPAPPDQPASVDPTRYLGTYTCDLADLVVSRDDEGRLWLDDTPRGMAVELGDTPSRTELVCYRDGTLIALHPDRGMHRVYAFLGDDGAGRAAYLHTGRALVRAG